ncbi:MAG TPA: ATP-binding protein [Cyclobacteriaceae bacterium]|nr:ATP-binding protein [Cyclobacteriaceae bacterium]
MLDQAQPLRILIVEDDETDYFIICEYIKGIANQTFRVEQCASYASAKELIPKKLFDIYFIDYRLGVKTGLDLLKLAIENHCEEPLILLTGKGNAAIDQEAMRVGAADYLIKSEISSESLERSMRYALTRCNVLKALRSSEKKYRTIFENSYDALFLANINFDFKDLNPAASKLLGHPKAELVEMNLFTFIKDDQVKSKITHSLLTYGIIHDFETEIINGDSEVKNCILSLSRHTTDDDQINLHGIIHDITGLKKIEKATLQAEKLSATWRIARTLAHEVRNPLSTIQMSLDQIEDIVQREGDRIFVEIIKRNSDRINCLITQLLESSRQTELTVEKTHLQKVIHDSVGLVKDKIDLKGIQLQVDFPADPVFINANPEKLGIAILNILVNAVDAVQPQDGTINLRLTDDMDACRILISDNGCGISPENLKNLFEPYFTSKKTGMGLGLASTLNIIKAHSGDIDVSSEVNKGTNFTITLPYLENQDESSIKKKLSYE